MKRSFPGGASLALSLLLACAGNAAPPSTVAAPPSTVAPPDPPPLPPTPPSAPAPPVPSPTPPAMPPPGARALHPLSPDMPSCIEMYSLCVPERGCTSAPFYLSCGQSGHVPDSRETLFCDCGPR